MPVGMETCTLGSRTFLLAKKYTIENSSNIKKGHIFVGKTMTNALFFKAQLKPQLLNKTFPKHFNFIIFPSDNLRVI